MTSHRRMPIIVDTTLRDGLQMPGIVLSFKQKLAIFRKLHYLGIAEAEIGCPASGSQSREEIFRLNALFPDIHCSAWCRARKEDIDHAVETGVDTVHISFPTSDRHLAIASFTRESVLRRCRELIGYALKKVPSVTIGAQDATRADLHFLTRFVQTAQAAGARRVRIADTVGCATPASITGILTTLKEQCPKAALEFHGHNDFGLATANTLAAMEAGIAAVSVTVHGVGERAGNAPLEEVLSAALHLYHFESSLNVHHLASLCNAVASSFNLAVLPQKAISGSNVFRHESGIHCHGMLRDKLAYQPINPESIGRRSHFSLGAQSGSSSMQAVLKNHGISVDRKTAYALWEQYHDKFVSL